MQYNINRQLTLLTVFIAIEYFSRLLMDKYLMSDFYGSEKVDS